VKEDSAGSRYCHSSYTIRSQGDSGKESVLYAAHNILIFWREPGGEGAACPDEADGLALTTS